MYNEGMENELSFGYWLQRRRKVLDLTQEALAARVHCSVATIRKIEIDLRRPSRELAELLALALEIDEQDRPLFLKVARGERTTARLAAVPQPTVEYHKPPAVPVQLPAPSGALIGRQQELRELQQLLARADCRLITLTGPGGVGKTRLALAVAHLMAEAAGAHQSPEFADGVFYVALAPLASLDSAAAVMAAGLGLGLSGALEPKQQLLHYLRSRQVLLILDNLEQLSSGADLVAELLQASSRCKLLVTSRERLALTGEWVFELSGLAVPPATSGLVAVHELTSYSAVTLFVESARRVRANFVLKGEDAAAVARICRLVDGLPLGVELAAAWVHLLACREIAAEIERNLDFLTANRHDLPERHRSLRAAFDYSWQLLTADEQRVLRQLAIFRGGFTRAASNAIVQATLPQLAALMSKSLLMRSGQGRYALPDLIRQYAEEKLAEVGTEAAAVRARHSAWYGDFVSQREKELAGEQQLQAIAALSSEIDNIDAAWRYAIHCRDQTAIAQPLRSLWFFFTLRGTHQAAAALFGWAVAELQQTDESVLLGRVTGLYEWFQQRKRHRANFQRLLDEQGVATTLAETFYYTGLLDWITNYAEQAETLANGDFTRFLELAREWSTICALQLVARSAVAQEEVATAQRLYRVIGQLAATAGLTTVSQEAAVECARLTAIMLDNRLATE